MEYKRLTFRHKSVVDGTEQIGYTERLAGYYRKEDMILNRLAELEDKIEQGTLVDLPCKVGDTVYRIRKKPYKAVLERFVVSITLCLNYKGQFEWRLFTTTEDTLGKTVFLTREEAEAKLKELQKQWHI